MTNPNKPLRAPRRTFRIKKLILRGLAVCGLLVAVTFVAASASPWPRALLVRAAFYRGAARTSHALEKHVPAGVAAQLDLHYDATDGDAYLDVFYPSEVENTDRSLPTVVWVHGGAWLSGTKDQIANYAKILAARGYAVVGVDYSIAPRNRYPVPVRQVNAALGYLAKNAQRLHVNPEQFVLAGDSGGAHIAAQLATAIGEPDYARALGVRPSIERRQLAGMLLYCGAYDLRTIDLNGALGRFSKTVLWSYSGSKNFMHDPDFATVSVISHVTSAFPPTFISAGNGDVLESQSRAFAEALAAHGVAVDSLFFAKGFEPSLPHEYQFDLDQEAGDLVLERSVAFLAARTGQR